MGVLEDLQHQIVSADRLHHDGVPSASIAILDNGEISAHVITSGSENVDTVYQSCSISKAITALAVAKLVDEEVVTYETKAIDHLPESTIQLFVEEETRDLMEHVTVAMLLSHTAGLSQGGFPGYIGSMPSAEDILAGRAPSNTPQLRFISFPGAQFSYSGGGYLILQLVLENVTRMAFAELMRKILLQPTGMTRSWFGSPASGENNIAKAHCTGAVQYPGGAKYHNFIELSAAGLWSTASDLLKAVLVIQKSLSTDSGFIKKETARKMLTMVKSLSSFDGISLGWFINGGYFAHTGGNAPGYNTYVLGYCGGELEAQSQNGVAIMTNTSLAHETCIKQIVNAIFYLKHWARSHSLPSYVGRASYVPYAAPEGSKLSEEWKDWIGQWDSEWWLLDQNGPVWKYGSLKPSRLYPAAEAPQMAGADPQSLCLVVDRLDIALRLSWDGDTRIIRLLQVEERVLKRTNSHPDISPNAGN